MSDLRAEMRERWEEAAAGWDKRADRVREFGMPLSMWMVEHLRLHPGERVLELAAGPGDTGFLAAELIRPGGLLICSDGAEAMLRVARRRAAEQGVDNAEFKLLELEWIDLDTASVDAVLCRWGVMLCADPAAALRESRRVLKPGGRIALAVWDQPELNPWATVPGRALIELGHAAPPDPSAPGMFSMAAPGKLEGTLEEAGFVDALVEAVDLPREYPTIDDFVEETLDMSRMFSVPYLQLSPEEQAEVWARMASLLDPYITPDDTLLLPGRSLAALANA